MKREKLRFKNLVEIRNMPIERIIIYFEAKDATIWQC